MMINRLTDFNYPDNHWLVWTGGMDSTFVLLDVLAAQVEFKFLYLLGYGSRNKLSADASARAEIRETIRARFSVDLPGETVIGGADDYASFKETQFELERMGYQMGVNLRWVTVALATIARQFNPLVSAHCSDNTLSKPGHERRLEYLRGKRIYFPVIKLSKADMLSAARIRGLDDILMLSMSCFAPSESGAPCGRCTQCLRRQGAIAVAMK